MRRLCAALLLCGSSALAAEPELDELQLLDEYPVAGIAGGNLSGLAWCNDGLWAVSDREDDRLYRLEPEAGLMRAEAESFIAPSAPEARMPWGLRMRGWVAGMLRGGKLDFEGLSCDAMGNRYLVSEARAAVLQLPLVGEPQWLALPSGLLRQARASGMMLHYNSLLEGVAIDPAGERLWLAAERMRRGVLVVHRQRLGWRCTGGCVLFSEAGSEAGPAQLGELGGEPRDFSGLAFYNEKLFTLERQAHRICRRTLNNGEVESCWSFAAAALTDERRYPPSHGLTEALWIDAEGAWLGVDNGRFSRADGEARPIVWRFAAPEGGWDGKP
ncbi:esterase-like activity of phytase family protein [Pseudomonas sp. EA_105y_Pfl2_R69]|uniref:esterase-like activity of phytase family protein n=1 Tax=Pseudomonas sp. EA_105y_Pfl2_R69 TaxID=3088683 RepID=UPI0030D6FD7E